MTTGKTIVLTRQNCLINVKYDGDDDNGNRKSINQRTEISFFSIKTKRETSLVRQGSGGLIYFKCEALERHESAP